MQVQRKRSVSVLVLLGLVAIADPVHAQIVPEPLAVADEPEPIEAAQNTIVVTARRREERLQDVPISVSALGQDALDARGFDAITDVEQTVPNLAFTPGQGGNSGGIAPFIRGVGENDFIITADPAVGLYIDGVYVARTFGATTELLGINRIEVLRGPQGSLFGKNTIGGAINVVSNIPGAVAKYEGDIRYGSYNTLRLRASVETPISDTLSLGVSALGEFGEGWQKIPSGDGLGNKNVVAGRALLHYDAAPFDVVLSFDGLHRRQNAAPHSLIAFNADAFFPILQNTFLEPCCTVSDRIDQTDTNSELNRDDTDAFNAALTVSYDIGDATLKSISGYRWVSAEFGRDGDASSTINYAGDFHDETAEQFSQELQLIAPVFAGRGNLLLGAYFFRENTTDDTRLIVADGLLDALQSAPQPLLDAFGFTPGILPFLDFNIDFDNRQKTTNYAAFANFTYDITDALSAEIGGRYTFERKRFTQDAVRIASGAPLIPGVTPYTLEEDWDAFSPRASLSYDITPEVMTYASWSRGFRSGGFNGRPTAAEEIGYYDPEFLTAYEVGVKSSFGPTVLNLALFRSEYTDQKLLVNKTNLNVTYEDAGRSRIQGLELELATQVSRRFQIYAALGLLDAKYLEFESFVNGVLTDLADRELKNAPEVTGSLSLAYTLPITDDLDARVRSDVSYRTQTFVDVENSPLRTPDYAIVNLSAEFDLPIYGTALRFGVDNVTDKQFIVAGFDGRASFGFLEAFYSEPRRYSVTFSIEH